MQKSSGCGRKRGWRSERSPGRLGRQGRTTTLEEEGRRGCGCVCMVGVGILLAVVWVGHN